MSLLADLRTEGALAGVVAAAFLVPWAFRRWERHMERGAAREQRRMTARRGRLYDWERDEYGWPS